MRVGIVGGGQLARMMAIAGQALGISCAFLDPHEDACAFSFGRPIVGAYADTDRLAQLASVSDVITFEFENVPASSLAFLSPLVPVFPSPEALRITQDRILEKTLFQQLGIPTVSFCSVVTLSDLEVAMDTLGLPLVLKTRTQGYDGKGQSVLKDRHSAQAVLAGFNGAPLIAEAMAPFNREVSIIGVRGQDGECRWYDLCQNVHHHGILMTSHPVPQDALFSQAQSYLNALMTHFNYVGVMTLELFECNGTLLANEFAPRVHNSGHWTIEGARTSQFENHLRAITNQPLGDTTTIGYPAIINCIGHMPATVPPTVRIHDYGKIARPGRKVGHLAIMAESYSGLLTQIQLALTQVVRFS